MTQEQIKNEIWYKISLKMLNRLLENGLITPSEYKKINQLNQLVYTPILAKVYE